MITITKKNDILKNIELSDQLMHQLYQTTRAISKSLNNVLRAHGLFSSEWTIIKVIKDQGVISQGSLSSYLSIEPAAISKTLIKLEEKGFIERKSGTDKREKAVFLTSTALENYDAWSQMITSHRKKMFDHLSEKSQKELSLLLNTIYLNTLH